MRTVTFTGRPYQFGYELGLQAKSIFASYIIKSEHFVKLRPWRESDWLDNVDQMIQHSFPRIYQELQGLADGCDQDYKDILLWNCRGDLLVDAPEGCTSIAVQKKKRAIIAHNEDGDPNLRGACFLLDATLDNKVRIFSFAYPGSIPGHSIGANSHGLVYTVNNIRLLEQGVGIPRMVISRALLEAKSCKAFIKILGNYPRSGGFHYTVADHKMKHIYSVEAPFQKISIKKVSQVAVHANHLIHRQLDNIKQKTTDSSRCRQQRMEALVTQYAGNVNEKKCFLILQDKEKNALPIFRTAADDPDQENTLATGVFTLSKKGVEVTIYDMKNAQKPTKTRFLLKK